MAGDAGSVRDEIAQGAGGKAEAGLDSAAFDKLTTVNRTRMLSAMIAEIQEAEQHNISGGSRTRSAGCSTRCPGATGSGP